MHPLTRPPRTLAAVNLRVEMSPEQQCRQDATVRRLELELAKAAAERYLHEHPDRIEGRPPADRRQHLRGGK